MSPRDMLILFGVAFAGFMCLKMDFEFWRERDKNN